MRDILLKVITSIPSRKQDLTVRESVEQNGFITTTERRCRYFIVNKVQIDDLNDIEKLAKIKLAAEPYQKRHYYVLREHNSKNGTDKLLCKASGLFYVVYGKYVYGVVFIHSFKITSLFTAVKNEDEDGAE